jgi:hypothetical protein
MPDAPMKTIHTILKEDFGLLDRNLVRSGLLSERGVTAVSLETSRNGLLVEYDPAIVDGSTLALIMCRNGVCTDPVPRQCDDRLADG